MPKKLRDIVENYGGTVGSWKAAKEIRAVHPTHYTATANHLASGRIEAAAEALNKTHQQSSDAHQTRDKVHDIIKKHLGPDDRSRFYHVYAGGNPNNRHISEYPHVSKFLEGGGFSTDRARVDAEHHHEYSTFDHQLGQLGHHNLHALGKAHEEAVNRGLNHLAAREEEHFDTHGKYMDGTLAHKTHFDPFMHAEEKKLGLPHGITDFKGKHEWYHI